MKDNLLTACAVNFSHQTNQLLPHTFPQPITDTELQHMISALLQIILLVSDFTLFVYFFFRYFICSYSVYHDLLVCKVQNRQEEYTQRHCNSLETD